MRLSTKILLVHLQPITPGCYGNKMKNHQTLVYIVRTFYMEVLQPLQYKCNIITL